MSEVMRRLVALLRRLPGVGEKTAHRLSIFLLTSPPEYGRELARALQEAVERVRPCAVCGNLSESTPCELCADPRRDRSLLCVVERVPDLMAIEASHEFGGLYHVLHGVLDPLKGVGPAELNIEPLFSRLSGEVREVILALSASVEGETTALYLRQRLQDRGVRVSRIASGIPVGGELEYVDRGTIGRALSGRREM
ncbi:MAG: recombination protein RecR [Myxococcales bacterium]|nr:recombination protein RecR [Myxococcales bacterium]